MVDWLGGVVGDPEPSQGPECDRRVGGLLFGAEVPVLWHFAQGCGQETGAEGGR